MSLAIVYSRAQSGFHAPEVKVEVHLSSGMPAFSIVGLPETAVKESKDRVRSAIINSHFDFPYQRLTVNLAPADLPKEGSRFDLPIALGILAATNQIPKNTLAEFEFAGELALSGELRAMHGALVTALACAASGRQLIVPRANASEAALAKDVTILPANHLSEVCNYLHGRQNIEPFFFDRRLLNETQELNVDLSDVQGQPLAKRALIVAAAGRHSMLMVGPPGTGKTMLASRLPTLLPPMTEPEAVETMALRSMSSKTFDIKLWRQRPFRNPHHTASSVALVGGGSPPRPGEISLAHHGVLFLDELPEFNRHVLEALREPLESGTITISRAARQAEFPASFQLIAAMNPCPCGHLGSALQACRCSPDQILRYRNRLSGPLLDRIDLQVEVKALSPEMIMRHTKDDEFQSKFWRDKVVACLTRQIQRQGKPNSQLAAKQFEQFCVLGSDQSNLLERAIKRLKLSARTSYRLLRVARTIADLQESVEINSEHLLEALSFRLPEA